MISEGNEHCLNVLYVFTAFLVVGNFCVALFTLLFCFRLYSEDHVSSSLFTWLKNLSKHQDGWEVQTKILWFSFCSAASFLHNLFAWPVLLKFHGHLSYPTGSYFLIQWSYMIKAIAFSIFWSDFGKKSLVEFGSSSAASHPSKNTLYHWKCVDTIEHVVRRQLYTSDMFMLQFHSVSQKIWWHNIAQYFCAPFY